MNQPQITRTDAKIRQHFTIVGDRGTILARGHSEKVSENVQSNTARLTRFYRAYRVSENLCLVDKGGYCVLYAS